MRQRRALIGLLVVASAAVAGCGFESPNVENTEHNSIQATDFSVGQMQVRDTSVTTVPSPTTGKPTSYLVVTFVNNGSATDTLTNVTSPVGTLTLTGQGVFGGTVKLLPGVPLTIDQPELSPSGPSLRLTPSGGTAPAVGSYVSAQFTFTTAGTSATVQVPVIPPVETTAATMPIPTATATVPTEVGQTAKSG